MRLKRKRRLALRAIFKRLRKRFPPGKGETVRLRIFKFPKSADHHAITQYRRGRKLSVISFDSRLLRKSQTFGRAVELLLHEYAHVRRWTKKDHGSKWGVAYARLYRWYFD